jgi:hypothetical protein
MVDILSLLPVGGWGEEGGGGGNIARSSISQRGFVTSHPFAFKSEYKSLNF